MSEERRVTRNIVIDDARLIFKNFRGEEGDYNQRGERNFGVLIDDQLAEELIEEGWNVKHLKPRADDPDGYRQPWLSVKVKFAKYPPRVLLIGDEGKIELGEEEVGMLDWTRSRKVDVVIRPFNYPAIKGRPAGVSAYLDGIAYFKDEDDFDKKYRDIPYIDRRDE